MRWVRIQSGLERCRELRLQTRTASPAIISYALIVTSQDNQLLHMNKEIDSIYLTHDRQNCFI
jgi:hypothetical protein